ncbi:MAG TPA: metal-dependent hydrolase [Gemmatimonadaceae bacterium]|nr:metal-dependent hydrolase [Gemmatimonadaceae bacterium]
MDNLCHSLVGATMSGAGLRRRTALATVTMVIGANLPDVDAIVYLVGDNADGLAFRRGWTHGVLAMVIWPFVLTAIMYAIGLAIERRRVRRKRPVSRIPLRASQLLLVSALSIWSHPLFDLLNTYGVRLLMPFSPTWFYGDTLFIVDPWVWCALGIGTTLSLRRARKVPVGAETATVMARVHRPARVALMAVAAYIAVMAATSRIGRVIVERQAVAAGLPPSSRVMVAPEAVTPFRRSVIRDLNRSYELGTLTWSFSPRYAPSTAVFPALAPASPVYASALRTRQGRRFLLWSRFPFSDPDVPDARATVRLDDARYASPGRAGFPAVIIPITAPVTAPPPVTPQP